MRDWKDWLKCSLIRAVRTMAQTAVGVIGGSVMLSDVDWKVVLSASALAGIVSLAMAVAGLPEERKKQPDLSEYFKNQNEIDE